jgi:hypothetical protein
MPNLSRPLATRRVPTRVRSAQDEIVGMGRLLKNAYSYQWRSPGWLAGPIFLLGGVALLGAGTLALKGSVWVCALGVLCALGGGYVASLVEGFDYAPLSRQFTKWSSRLGVRRDHPAVKVKEGSWIALVGEGPRPFEIQLQSESDPATLLLRAAPRERATQIAQNIAKVLKVEYRDPSAPSSPESP